MSHETDDKLALKPDTDHQARKTLSKDAQNALKEAKARREQIDQVTKDSSDEQNGRGGLDPARYGDWEVKGISSDF